MTFTENLLYASHCSIYFTYIINILIIEDISERKYLNHIQYKKHEKINAHVTNI